MNPILPTFHYLTIPFFNGFTNPFIHQSRTPLVGPQCVSRRHPATLRKVAGSRSVSPGSRSKMLVGAGRLAPKRPSLKFLRFFDADRHRLGGADQDFLAQVRF